MKRGTLKSKNIRDCRMCGDRPCVCEDEGLWRAHCMTCNNDIPVLQKTKNKAIAAWNELNKAMKKTEYEKRTVYCYVIKARCPGRDGDWCTIVPGQYKLPGFEVCPVPDAMAKKHFRLIQTLIKEGHIKL